MSAQIQVQAVEDVLRVVVHGEVTASVGDEVLAQAITQARETGCFRLLLDLREAQVPDDAAPYQENDLADRFGIRRTDRIALLCPPEDPRCKAMAQRATDAGLLLGYFTEEREAVDWLHRRMRLFPRLFRRFRSP